MAKLSSSKRIIREKKNKIKISHWWDKKRRQYIFKYNYYKINNLI